MSDEPRYFVDHDTIHDRITGKHVELEEAAGMLSVEPESMQRIAWGVVVELGAKLKNAECDRDRLAAENARLATEVTRIEGLRAAAEMGRNKWESIAIESQRERDSLRERVAELEKERDALRASLVHACELQKETYENRRELWAMRQTANLTSLPFTHERVMDKYNELGEQSDCIAECARLTTCLAKANEQAESFERLWYLTQDEIERVRDSFRDLSDECHRGFDGGYKTIEERDIFHHGMETVCNIVKATMERLSTATKLREES